MSAGEMTASVPMRASCIRCNAVIEIEWASIEARSSYVRCACGARSPMPETLLRAVGRPGARTLADVLNRHGADLILTPRAQGISVRRPC